MGYGRGDSSPFDFEPKGIPFGSKSNGNLSPRPHPIQCERKWSFLSAAVALSTNRLPEILISSCKIANCFISEKLHSLTKEILNKSYKGHIKIMQSILFQRRGF